jgi:hypothetical protein
MGVCTGCALLFQGLKDDVCMKCVKLQGAASAIDRGVIEVMEHTNTKIRYSFLIGPTSM